MGRRFVEHDKYRHSVYDIHTVDESGRAAPEKNAEKIRQRNRDIQVCLTCTRKTCSGREECFKKEKERRHD